MPAPVRLLDSSGPRYPIERFAEAAAGVVRPPTRLERVTRGSPSPRVATSPGSDEQVVKRLMGRDPKLSRFISRRGRKPGAGSPSEWDFAAGCSAAEHGANDEELAALVRAIRKRHGEGKGQRDDYVALTVRRIRAKVGRPTEVQEPDEILTSLTDRTGVTQAGLRVVDVVIRGHGEGADGALILSDGSTVEFARVDHVAMPSKLGHRLAVDAGIAAEFTTIQAHTVAALMRRFVGRKRETERHRVAVGWGFELLERADEQVFEFSDKDSRWDMWTALKDRDPEADGRLASAAAFAAKLLVARDKKTGTRYVRAGWVQEFVRRTGSRESPGDVVQLLERVGWTRPENRKGRINAYGPKKNQRLALPMFVVPAGWDNDEEDAE